MAEFIVTGPDGKKYRVQGENAEGAARAVSKMLAPQEGPTEPQAGPTEQPVTQGSVARRDGRDTFSRVNAVRDFLVGDGDPNTTTKAEQAGINTAAFLNKAGESLTLGIVGDEAAGAADEMIGRRERGTGVDFYRDQEKQFAQDHPGAAVAAEFAPLAIPGIGAAGWTAKGLSTGQRLGRAAMAGGGAAATYAAMESEGDIGDRAVAGATAAPLGVLFGFVGAKAGDMLAGLPRGLARRFDHTAKRPSVQALRDLKNQAYKVVDDSGEMFSAKEMRGLYQKVDEIFQSGNYVEEVDNASRATLKILERQGDTSISKLDRIRRGLWDRYNSNPEQTQILDAIGAIDDLIDSRAGASEAFAAARAANSRYSKAQMLEDAFTKATDQTSATGSGGNILNKYRQAVSNIINNPSKARFFSQEEVDLMRNFVRGDMPENVLRKIGKLSPNGNGLMMALHTYGAVATSGATVPLMAAGAGAKAVADRRVIRGAERLQDVVSGHTPAQVPVIRPQGAAAGVVAAPVASEGAQSARNITRSLTRRDQRR